MKKREPVSHIMSKTVYSVHRHQNLLEVSELMDLHGIRHVPVLDGTDVVGIVSRTDIMRASYGVSKSDEVSNRPSLQTLSVESAMSPQPIAVAPDTTIREVAETLAELELSALPVLVEGNLVGIVTTTDLIRYLLEQY